MSIFHDTKSLKKRYLSGLSYKKSKVDFIKGFLVVGAFAIIGSFAFSVYIYDKETRETAQVKETFDKSKNYDMYAENLKYQDVKNNKTLHSKKISVDENSNKSFTNVTVESKDSNEIITAKKASVKKDSSQYLIQGDVKYKTDDVVITSDEGVYDSQSGKIKAQGNFKLVISTEDE